MIKLFFILFIFWYTFLPAQNLIPNPGFEEHKGDSVFYWIQPAKPCYHFKYSLKEPDAAYSGTCTNGICIRNTSQNEYFHIKLKQKLFKDRTYYLSMYVRLSTEAGYNSYRISNIGWYFSKNDSLQKITLGNIRVKPQVSFIFNEDAEQVHWMLMESKYIAKGTEEYLTIGHFIQEQTVDSNRIVKDTISALATREISSEKYAALLTDINMKKKNTKKQNEEFRKQVREIIMNQPKPKHQLAIEKEVCSQYYFDNFCLSLIKEDGSYDCKEKILDFEVGSTVEIKNIFFETGKARILAQSYQELDSLYRVLMVYSNIEIQINGHTDNQGNDSFNQKLSEDRARSVVEYLVAKGIAQKRLSYKGYGSSKPVSANNTEEGRKQNRRVEFTVERK